MSYCRWSSDDFKCDIYAYEHVGGYYSINVAGRRRKGPYIPFPAECYINGTYKYGVSPEADRLWKQTEEANEANMEDIDLPYAGEEFVEKSLEAFRDRLLELRKIGYHFPDSVIDMIDEEIDERENSRELRANEGI